MTLREAKREVKEWGLRLTWSPETLEYGVHVDQDNVGEKHSCEPCYFTDDLNDALDTAHDLYLRGRGRKDLG